MMVLIATHVRTAGGAVYVEPKYVGSLRPDAQVFFPSATDELDVSITHPSCKSYASMGAKEYLAAKAREAVKHKKYDSQSSSNGAKFIPFVLETYGGFGKEALAFIKKLSKFYTELSPTPVHESFSLLVSKSISVALQKGNALVQLAASQAARIHAGRLAGYR